MQVVFRMRIMVFVINIKKTLVNFKINQAMSFKIGDIIHS